MRPYSTASVKRSSPAKPAAMASTSQGMAQMARIVNSERKASSAEKASRANPRGSSPASSFFANIGTKAMLNAPSAKKRRKRLGSEKATMKAWAWAPVPR